MTDKAEKRSNPRLKLRYPIRIARGDDPEAAVVGRTVTKDLGPRGAYFSTFQTEPYVVGECVSVVVTVPHRLAAGGQEVLLDMRGTARVVRVEGPSEHRRYGEDGAALAGVAIEFANPLTFHYRWV
jgi:hypothetical protein